MTLTHAADAPTDEYLDLIRLFPLRRVRGDAEYDAGAEMLEKLSRRGHLSDDAQGYHDALLLLLREYDERVGDLPRHEPLAARMQALINAGGTDAAHLAQAADVSDSLASDVLAGRRGWTQPQIRRLADYYKLDAAYFINEA